MLYHYLRKAQNLLFPACCVLCNAKSKRNIDLCHECEQDLPWAIQVCVQCGQTMPKNNYEQQLCGQCIQKHSIIRRILPLCDYQAPLDNLITAAKFHGQLAYSHLFGELIAKRVREDWYKHQDLPDIIIAMPLHKKRLRERGYNQALEIAKPVAKQLKIRLNLNSCQRSKATTAQTELTANARAQNVKGAFIVRHPITAKHVAIIDDVVTTGHTVNELAHCLKQAGVSIIDVWCCARTNV